MSEHNREVGKRGEQVAAEYLEECGYRVLARNVRTPYGEIDLVTEKEGITVFVEVKTRTSASLGPPELAVTTRKQAHMLAAGEQYAQEHALQHWQIDVVAVRLRTGMNPEITHFERALG
jgi:putative endonuclease